MKKIILLAITLLFTNCSTSKNPTSTNSLVPSNSPSIKPTITSSFSQNKTSMPSTSNTNNQKLIPDEANLEVIETPDTIVGTGTPESCTSEEFIKAVEKGGKIKFNSGNKQATIILTRPAKVINSKPDIVIDGGGLITLSGNKQNRIIYMNTCDKNQGWTTSHCDNQEHPKLTLQNISLIDGNSSNEKEYDGGGAIWVRGGRLKLFNCSFFGNECSKIGPDVGGGAVRVFSQYNNLPVYVTNCTFGSEEKPNIASNGGAISSIGVSWSILNCKFIGNKAVGNGGNPAKQNTTGGGSGGAIYNDGNKMTLSIINSIIEKNSVNSFGSSIFFVTNNHTGNIIIKDSTIQNNIGGSWYPKYKSISMHDDTNISVTNSSIK